MGSRKRLRGKPAHLRRGRLQQRRVQEMLIIGPWAKMRGTGLLKKV